MFPFESITVRQLRILSELIIDCQGLSLQYIRSRYSVDGSNFQETLDFLEKIRLISINEETIVASRQYQRFLNKFVESGRSELFLKEFFTERLVIDKCSLADEVREFLSRFRFQGGRWEFTPSNIDRLKFSGLRNLLMDLDMLEIDAPTNKYIIARSALIQSDKRPTSGVFTREDFLKILREREEIGWEAELQVLDYEKRRLSFSPRLVDYIKHVAEIDVNAGFDIRSFEEELGGDGEPVTRYIEVKAVSPADYRFYWTANEIDAARAYGEQYFLYLLPVVPKRELDITSLMIIKDPYSTVYENQNEWIRTVETFCFSLVHSSVHHNPRNH
jgi:hypothetical protein